MNVIIMNLLLDYVNKKDTHVIIVLKVYVFFVRFQIMPFIFVIFDTKFDIFLLQYIHDALLPSPVKMSGKRLRAG